MSSGVLTAGHQIVLPENIQFVLKITINYSDSRVSKSRDKGVVTPVLSGSSDSFSRNNDVSATSGTRGRPPESSARGAQDSIAADPGEPYHARAVTIKLSSRFCVKPIYAHVSRFAGDPLLLHVPAHVMLSRIILQNFLRLHTRRNKKETANNGARHSGTICVGAKCSFTLTRGVLRRIAQIFVYRSIGLDFTGSEPGLISREKNGTIKCLHDHFGGAGGRVWCLGDCWSAEVPEATMTTVTTGDGWVDGWPRVYGLCACGSSSGTRIFQ
ncbi:hypothetical protein G5I_00894 [Acromyrmex echinatior]|uniref:Uncharacterized protein n=1 Tax=Acromyrmex echinatior TaxID=103372 RepID=F4W6R1_ACREC|nr:hypothetical protein G5I_00894 [Acromyrmex echinatior]